MTVGFVLIFRKWVIGEKGTAHKKLQCWRTDGLYLGASKDHCALAIQDQRSIKVQGSRFKRREGARSRCQLCGTDPITCNLTRDISGQQPGIEQRAEGCHNSSPVQCTVSHVRVAQLRIAGSG